MSSASLTWLGHGSFRLDSPGGKRIYVDPWLEGNPTCPESEYVPERCDIVAVTHGHQDHWGGLPVIGQRFAPQIVAQFEVKQFLGTQGVDVSNQLPGLGKGGSTEIDGIRFTLTNAFHSSSSPDGRYLGEPCGIVVRLEDQTTVYFSGDTCVFGDMELIGKLYRPAVVCLPIGDHFTMGPDQAAVALQLLGAPRCVPCHWGTFPLLTGTPDRLRELAPAGVEIVDVEPGGSIPLGPAAA